MRRLAVLALACLVLSGCQRSAEVIVRPVRLNTLEGCAVSPERAFALLHGWGDFDVDERASPAGDFPGGSRTSASAAESLYLRDLGAQLTRLPTGSRSIVASVSQPDPARAWRGIARVPEQGPIDLLLWPETEACRFSQPVEHRIDGTFAAVDPHHALLAGGRVASGSSVPRTHVVDLAEGRVVPLPIGLGTRRSSPTITAFAPPGGRAISLPALVAGGSDPDSQEPLRTAEVYAPAGEAIGDFERDKIELNEARAEHGACALATGETLLVGGRGSSGLLRALEIVDPRTRRSRTGGLALLQVPRRSPAVLRLASGEILVAGGVDREGAPISTLEWLSPDASRPSRRPRELLASRRRAFIPLDAGGALAVIAPDPPDEGKKSVWVIGAEGEVTPAISVQDLEDVRLFAGVDGAPLLFTGRRWLRWQPWFAAFQQVIDAPAPVPNVGGPASSAFTSPDPGLALWLDDQGEAGMFVRGFRHGTRNELAPVPRPLLVKDTAFLAPDRFAAPEVYRFDVGRGLVLAPGASAFLTDVTFAGVSVELQVTSAAPRVVLRDDRGEELEIGGPGCPVRAGSRQKLTIERGLTSVRVMVDEGQPGACAGKLRAEARVAVGLRGAPEGEAVAAGSADGTSSARSLFVSRR